MGALAAPGRQEKPSGLGQGRGYVTSLRFATIPLTGQVRRSILGVMVNEKSTNAADTELNRLEHRLSELIRLCEQLSDENRWLRSQQASLTAERANLIEKNEQVKVRVEAMIHRLKSLERSQ